VSNTTIGRPFAWRHLEVLVLVAVVAACATPGPSTPPGGTAPGGTAHGGTTPAALADHPLLGAWTVDITRADVAAGGITDPGTQNENAGRFVWTFSADGTWTQVQQSLDGAPVNNPVFQGTFTIVGDQLVMITEFPEQYRDDGLHYTWAVEGDEARFDLLDPPDPVLPLIVETHPWKRAG
jgi:hypothetical protein